MSGRKSGLLFVIICIVILVVFTQGKGSLLPKVSDKLLSELKSPDEAVRFLALRKLETMRNVSGIAGFKIALQDKSPRIRQRALDALRREKSAEAIDVIIDALKHEDPKIKRKAASYLKDFRDKRAIQPLISAMNDPDVGVRLSLSGALSQWREPEVMNALLNALKDENANIRAYAARAMGFRRDRTVVPDLLRVAKDKAYQVRAMSIYALGFLADKRSVAALVEALQDRSVEVRLQAVQAIRRYKGLVPAEDSRNYLERAFSDKAAQVRGVAYVEFSSLFAKEVTFPFVVKGLSDEDASVRLKVLEVLRRYGPTYSPSILFPALKDHDCRNRVYAARSIGAFKHKEIVQRLHDAFDGQCKMPGDIVRFIEFRGQMKKENFSALKEKLYDSDHALVSIGSPSGIAILKKAVKQEKGWTKKVFEMELKKLLWRLKR